MAKAQIKLSDPRIATVVLVLLTVVAGVNLRTFFPGLFSSDDRIEITGREIITPDDLKEAAVRASDLVSGRDSGTLEALGAGTSGNEPIWWCDSPFRAPSKTKADNLGTLNSATEETKTELKVVGVMISDRRSLAWIDGGSRSIGDIVRGFKIESISREGVWLSKKGQRKFLPVQSENPIGPKYHLITQPDSSRYESGL